MIPGATHPKYPFTVGVSGLVVRRGKALLVKLAYGSRGWILPGGFLRPDETIGEGVKREVREETGLLVKPTQLVSIRNRIKDGRNDLYLTFLVKVVGGKLRPDGKETVAVGYFSLAEMKNRSDIPKLNTLVFGEFLADKKHRFSLSHYRSDARELYELWA